MACKLKCPKCGKMLKEEGDEGKQARGDYRVYDNLSNCKVKAGEHRLILCLLCNQATNIKEFEF